MTKAELEARRDSQASIKFEYVPDQNCFCDGFDFAAALLQGEMDAKDVRIEKLMSVISEMTSLPCDSHQYPNCTVCRSIDVVAHADLGNELNNYESQLQSANAKLAVATRALKKISANKDMCIYGTAEMPDDSIESFRLGSNFAYIESAHIADEFLASLNSPDPSSGEGVSE